MRYKGPIPFLKAIDKHKADLRRLTNGGWGRTGSSTFYKIEAGDNRQNNEKAIAFLAYNDDKEVVGWALMEPYTNKRATLDIYVRPDHRRRGIATKMTRKIKAFAAANNWNLVTSPWNNTSERFFNSVDL